jgi:hypothetical protein
MGQFFSSAIKFLNAEGKSSAFCLTFGAFVSNELHRRFESQPSPGCPAATVSLRTLFA